MNKKKNILTLAIVFLLILSTFSVLLPKAQAAANLGEAMLESMFDSTQLATGDGGLGEAMLESMFDSTQLATGDGGLDQTNTYGFEPDLSRRIEAASPPLIHEVDSLAEQIYSSSWQKSSSITATGTSTTVFYEDFEGAFPGSWSVGDSNPTGGSDYWGDTSYRAYGGSWSGWCADEGTQSGTITIFYENFEGAWPGSWSIGDWNPDSGYDYWGDYYWKYHEGHWSGYCADEGSHPSGSGYDNDMEAYMYRSVSLSGYSSVTLSYWYWTNIEDGYDYLYVLYKVGGTWYITDSHTGSSAGWRHSSVSIPTTATHVGFYFYSDFIITKPDAAFIDEVELEGTGETPNKSVHKYDNYMDSYLSRGSFDASNWDLAYVTFYAWIATESDCDFITFDTSGSGSGGPWHELWSRSGNYKYWSQHTVRVPDDDLTSNLWVGFDFISDLSVTYEGVYLDNVALKWYDVTLDNYNIDPTKVDPGDSFTLGYYIDNPTSYTIDVGLGASIRDSSNNVINDIPHDTVVSASPGAHWYYRPFEVPNSAPKGLYDVAWGIWSGTPGSSRWWGGSGWQEDILTVGIPDLTISVDGTTKPDMSPGDPVAGEPIRIWFVLDNIGKGDALSSFTNYFYVDSKRWEQTQPGLDTETAVLIYLDTTEGPGYHSVKAEADVSDDIDESDEDNEDSKVMWWKSPDLIVLSVWTDPSTLYEDQPFTIHFKIKNEGDADATETFRTQLKIDGVPYADRYKHGLSAGATCTWSVDYLLEDHSGLSTGSHDFEVIVDIDDNVAEANKETGSGFGTGESNNWKRIDKNVQPLPEGFHYQINNYYCGPASLEMVFDYYGPDISQCEIAGAARTDSRYEHPGTYLDDMVRAAHFSGMSWTQGTDEDACTCNGYTNRNWGYSAFYYAPGTPWLNELRTLVDDGYWIIVSTWYDAQHDTGHYRVILGYDDFASEIILHDPWDGPNLRFSYDEFIDLWSRHNYWALFVHPWVVSVTIPEFVAPSAYFTVTATVTYLCPEPFSATYYPATAEATITLPPGFSLPDGETQTKPLGTLVAGSSSTVSWQVVASSTPDSYEIGVVARGVVSGSVGDRYDKDGNKIYSAYSYQDRIGGSGRSTLRVEVRDTRVEIISGDGAVIDRFVGGPNPSEVTLGVQVKDTVTEEYLHHTGSVEFYVNGILVGTDADDDEDGIYRVVWDPPPPPPTENWLTLGSQTWEARFTGTSSYNPSSTSSKLTIYGQLYNTLLSPKGETYYPGDTVRIAVQVTSDCVLEANIKGCEVIADLTFIVDESIIYTLTEVLLDTDNDGVYEAYFSINSIDWGVPHSASFLCYIKAVSSKANYHDGILPEVIGFRIELLVQNVDSGLDYPTIQAAIDAPETLDGHTISVEEGIYNENIVVGKSLKLVGENMHTTIVNGNSIDTCFRVLANGVHISGFTIQNSADYRYGILLEGSLNNTVVGNNIINNYYGVGCTTMHQTTAYSQTTYQTTFEAFGSKDLQTTAYSQTTYRAATMEFVY